jgi:hypothetical protein
MKKCCQLKNNKAFVIMLVLMALICSDVFAQDSDILVSLNYPAYGVKIKNNFPNGSGKFARAFMLSNQDGSNDLFGLGAFGEINNGISTLDFGFIGSGYDNPSMVFLPSGNIGIEISEPLAKLHLIGSAQDAGGNLLMLGPTTGANLRLGYNANYSWIQSHGSKPLHINEQGNNVVVNLSGGNVGIGIAVPNEKLSVNGKIRAHEIKVETANWPDYVFAKDYQIPSLAETEKHIKEKGHLPGIPSAEEVKNNGIDLGDMNAKLLQKIEELTLLLIEEHKTLKEQVQKLEVQGKKIEQQQTEINQLKRNR